MALPKDAVRIGDLPSDAVRISEEPAANLSTSIPGLPGRARVEQLQAERKDPLATLLDEIDFQKTKKYKNFLSDDFGQNLSSTYFDIASMKPIRNALVTGFKTMAVPFGRAESALSSFGIEAQEGNYNPINLLDAFTKGLKGEKQSQFGDLIRSTEFGGTFNEPLAATTGFFAMSGFDKLINKGDILKAANNFATSIPKRLPKIMNKDFLLDRATILKGSIDDLEKSLGKEVESAVNKVGGKLVKDPEAINEALEILPDRVRKSVEKSLRTEIGIKEGSIPTTIKNTVTLRRYLDEFADFADPDVEERLINKSANLVRQAINSSDESVARVNEAFHVFKDQSARVRKLVTTKSEGKLHVTDKGLRNLYSKTGDRGLQKEFEGFLSRQDLPEKAQNVVKEVLAFNGRQKLKSVATKAALATAGVGIGFPILGALIGNRVRNAIQPPQ